MGCGGHGGRFLAMPAVLPERPHKDGPGDEADDRPQHVPLVTQFGHDLTDQGGIHNPRREVLHAADHPRAGWSHGGHQCADRGCGDGEGNETGGRGNETYVLM